MTTRTLANYAGPPDDWKPHSGTKAFLFDKDGTLVDQNARCREYMLQICELGERAFARDVSEQLGWSFEEARFNDPRSALAIKPWSEVERIVAETITRHHPSSSREDVLRRASAYANATCSGVASTVPLFDVKRLFSELQAAGCAIGIVTSDARQQTLLELEHLGVSDQVGAIVCGDDAGVEAKPDPSGIRAACRELGVDPTAAIYVGDAVTDVEAGTAAGCRYRVAVRSGLDVGSTEEYQAWCFGKAGATHIFADAEEIRDNLHAGQEGSLL